VGWSLLVGQQDKISFVVWKANPAQSAGYSEKRHAESFPVALRDRDLRLSELAPCRSLGGEQPDAR